MQDNLLQKPKTSQSSGSEENSAPPTINYWHVWTDQDGISHQSRCQVQNFTQQGIAPGTSPQWISELKQSGVTISFTVLPVGWVGNWHENPKPQWIIPLSGRWFVETMDGQRVEMGSGDISFGEDQNTKEDSQGHKGHLSGTVGEAPAVLMMLQLEEKPTIEQHCRFS